MYMVTKRVKFLLPCDIATGFKVFGNVEFDVPNGWTATFDNKDQAVQLTPDPHSGALSAAERETAKLMAFIRDALPVKYRTLPGYTGSVATWVDYIIAAAQRLIVDAAERNEPDYARGVLERFFKDEKNRVFHTYTSLPVDSENVGMAAVQIMEALNKKRKEQGAVIQELQKKQRAPGENQLYDSARVLVSYLSIGNGAKIPRPAEYTKNVPTVCDIAADLLEAQRLKIERLEARIKWMEQGPTYEFADETNTKLNVKWDFGVPPAMNQIVHASTGKYRVTNIEWVPSEGIAKVRVKKRHIETVKVPFTMPPGRFVYPGFAPSMECRLTFALGNGLGRCRRLEGHSGPHSQAPDGPPPPPLREFVGYGVTPLKPLCGAFTGPSGVVRCNKSLGHVGPCGIE